MKNDNMENGGFDYRIPNAKAYWTFEHADDPYKVKYPMFRIPTPKQRNELRINFGIYVEIV